MLKPDFPTGLEPIRNSIIEAVHSGAQVVEGFDSLTGWLESDGYDALLPFFDPSFLINLNNVSISDDDLRDHFALPAYEILSDDFRTTYLKKWISEAIQNPYDGWIFPSPITYPLKDESERAVFLGGIVEIHGQAGPVIYWHGAFKTEDEYFDHLKSKQIYPLDEATNISNDALIDIWDWELGTVHHTALRSKPLKERIRLVSQDIKRKKNGGRSYYRSMDTARLAELIGVENIDEDSLSKWMRFDAMYRRNLDDIFECRDMDGEEAFRILESIISEKLSSASLPGPSKELVAKASLLDKEKTRLDVVNCLGEVLTLELEELLNLHELQEQAANGILGHAMWSYECANGINIRFQVDLSDLGEVEDMIGPYDDLLGRFSDGPDFVVSW
jgi:hypothetical protein